MKQYISILALLLGLNTFAQKHYYWSTNSDYSLFGRVIDIREVAPNVLALQTFSMDNHYQFKKAQLSLFDLATEKQSDYSFLYHTPDYRGGFGALSDGSFVVCSENEEQEYELINYKYNPNDFKLNVEGKLIGKFYATPGNIAVFKETGHVTTASIINTEADKVSNQLFIKSPGSNFGIAGQQNGVNILMKPFFISANHDFSTKADEGLGANYSYQVIANKNGEIINYTLNSGVSNSGIVDGYAEIKGYSPELKEEWGLKFNFSLGVGFKPIAMMDSNEWFLTTFDENHNTTILKYNDGNKTDKEAHIKSFEANGSFVLKNGDLCVYGFQQNQNDNEPAFYTLNTSTLEIKKTWELTLKDQPCQEISELTGQEILLPGKFYSATQLSDGSVVFGGHLVSNSVVKDTTTAEQTTFNYLMVMPNEFFK